MSVVNVFVAPIVLDLMDLKNKYIDYWHEKIQYFKPCGKKGHMLATSKSQRDTVGSPIVKDSCPIFTSIGSKNEQFIS